MRKIKFYVEAKDSSKVKELINSFIVSIEDNTIDYGGTLGKLGKMIYTIKLSQEYGLMDLFDIFTKLREFKFEYLEDNEFLLC